MSPETEQKLLAMVRQCIETRIAAGLPVDEASWPDWLFGIKPPRKPGETCDHERWSFEKHGRCCPDCGTFCLDFGD